MRPRAGASMASATGRALQRHRLDSVVDQCVTVSCQMFWCDSSASILWSQAYPAQQCEMQWIMAIHTRSGLLMAAPLRRAAPTCGCTWEFKGLWQDVWGGFFVCTPCTGHGMRASRCSPCGEQSSADIDSAAGSNVQGWSEMQLGLPGASSWRQ